MKNAYTQIKAEGHVHRSEIGVFAQTITPPMATGLRLPQDWGVLLSDVTPGGPADKAGLKVGDIAVTLNGRLMTNARQLDVRLYRYSPGQNVSLEILREGSKMTVSVPVAERKDDPQRFADMVDPTRNLVPKLGILGITIDKKVAGMFPELRNAYGIVVAATGGESPYSGDSLQLGDVIYSVNTEIVTSVEALRTAIDNLKDTDPLVLQVERDGRLLYLTTTIE